MRTLVLLSSMIVVALAVSAEEYELASPDGKLVARIKIAEGIQVTLQKGGSHIVTLGNLALNAENSPVNPGWQVQEVSRNTVNETVTPEIREKANTLLNSYNELTLRFSSIYSLTFRLFNEGLAYRFATASQDPLVLAAENLDLYCEEEDAAWYQASKTFCSPYETPYEHKPVPAIKEGELCHLPLLIKKKNGLFLMITEADLYNYPGLWLKGTGKAQFTAANPKYPKEYRKTKSIYDQEQVRKTHDYIARVEGTRTYPWRIFAVADDEQQLVANDMVYLLATPCALTDVSWIHPGVVMFDWWAKNSVYGVDFKAGINTETAKYFIDFCAEKGFRYFLFDDGWCPKENLLQEVPGLDMAEVTAYAREKNVDVMLWVIWHSLKRQWDEAFDLFEKWGVKGIKMDFMNRDDQEMVAFYERVAAKAAEKKMVVNYHGAYKPCGLRRKYPNVLTREGLIEFEWNGWTDLANPAHHNLLPYIRMFTGPMDYIPGTLRNATKDNFRPVGDYPMGQGTRAHAMALFVILNSPMTMLPDSPSDYYRENECTDFLAKIPVEWDETQLLAGKIGEYTVIARRAETVWHVGAITNWDERSLDLDTGFLAPGKYRIEAIQDGVNANTRAEDYKKMEREFNAGEVLSLNLASGGGWVARIYPL